MNGFAFGADISGDGDVIDIAEPETVLNHKAAFGGVNGADFHRCDNLLVLFQAGTWCLVWEDQAIHTEVVVVRVVAVVAAVFVERLAVFVACQNTVVTPFPDEVTLNAVMLVEHVLVFGQAARAVTHGVGVFTDNARLGVWMFTEVVHQLRA